MKPLSLAIAAFVALTLVMMPALQAKAADDSPDQPTPAWTKGYNAGKKCVTDKPENCRFTILHDLPKAPEGTDLTPLALENSDYIAGFIAGKSAANSQ